MLRRTFSPTNNPMQATSIPSSLFVKQSKLNTNAAPSDVAIIDVPQMDLSMPEWKVLARKLRPGEDIKAEVTIRNLSSNNYIPEEMSIRIEEDGYFQPSACLVSQRIPSFGEIKVPILLKARGGITNLNTLPPSKEILLTKSIGPGKLAKLASMHVVVPMGIVFFFLLAPVLLSSQREFIFRTIRSASEGRIPTHSHLIVGLVWHRKIGLHLVCSHPVQ